MKRGFRGAPRPLLPSMLLVATNPTAGQEHAAVAQSQPSSSLPQVPSSQPTPTPPPIPTPRLVTPPTSKAHASGEEQMEDISPNTLEAAITTLSQVCLFKRQGPYKGREIQEKEKRLKINSSSDDLMLLVRKLIPTSKSNHIGIPHKKEEEAKQIHLDALLAQRIAEEEELTEQQKKRKAQVQFEAQFYTNEDWDLIRAKLEANAELSKSMLGSELQGEDFAKENVWILIKYIEDNSPDRNLSFEEVKEVFDKCFVKQIESFAPISFEATKASLKRFGEELQTKTPKRLKEEKDDEAKDDESTKKSGKRRKQMARKGMNTSVDENDSEDSDKVGEHEESNTGTETPINPVPVAMKTPSVATYKIIKQGEKGVYQIVREDGTDIVYINFGAMLKSISRDDLQSSTDSNE
ncbi:hypothetical protein Tco_0078653 [Tanacetum coccineum]